MAPADENLTPSGDEGAGPASEIDAGPQTPPAAAPARPGNSSESAVADAGPADASAPAQPTADGADRISLSFSRVCWVRVVDATGATLSQGQRNAGDTLNLEGEAPFRLTVGDAAAVSALSINGESVSLPSQRSGDVVRVTLP
ncbi:MAG: DUF4115 domain-containing protein [Alcanivorax sp.]|nr:DUF4115 domain-containing protein [Alcanivorax sp.]